MKSSKKLYHLILLSILLVSSFILLPINAMYIYDDKVSLSTTTMAPTYTNEYADNFGNKAANLFFLKQNEAVLNNILNNSGITIQIPDFVTISNEESNQILKSRYFNVSSIYNGVNNCKDIFNEFNEQAKKENKEFISEETKNLFLISMLSGVANQIQTLKHIGQPYRLTQSSKLDKKNKKRKINNIEKKYPSKRMKLNNSSKKIIQGTSNILSSKKIKLFLNTANENNWKIMVRSTGKEDNDDLSNAGGNFSQSNVNPNSNDIEKAILNVISSYLSSKSLVQRQKSGEQNESLFQKPSIPILLQRMIGEKLGGADKVADIPVSCVIYTQEPYANTPGITMIQASFGHNEGVVDNKVAIDTFYVGPNNQINKILKTKDKRIVPIYYKGKYGLGYKSNSSEIKNSPSLDNKAILAIKKVADAIHNLYGKVMDIELIYKPSSKTIYLVQARPLIIEKKLAPEYIQDVQNISNEKIIKSSTIIPADCKVKTITACKQIIIADTLENALKQFNKPEFDANSVDVIVVEGQAEATSHAAAIFRGAGKAVLVTKGIEKLRQVINKENFCLWIDLQRGLIVESDSLSIKKGFYKHPIPGKFTIPCDYISQQSLHSTDVCDYYNNLSIENLIDLLRDDHNSNIQEQIMQSILLRIGKKILEVENDKKVFQELKNKMKNIYNSILNIKEQIVDHNLILLQKLYLINILQAILFQEKDNLNVDDYSFVELCRDYEDKKKFIAEKQNIINQQLMDDERLFEIAYQGYQVAFTKNLENKWIKFIQKNTNNRKQLLKLIELINKFAIFPTFINLYFNQNQDEANFLTNIFKELKSESILKEVYDKKIELDLYELSVWEKPQNFEFQLNKLQNNFVNFFKSPNLKNIFLNKNDQLLKIITLVVMEKLIDVFDRSIKTLKGSNEYSDYIQKVINFKRMLKVYFELQKITLLFVPNGAIKYCEEGSETYTKEKYFEILEDILNNKVSDSIDQLNPSLSFSVVNSVLGSATNISLNLPQTAEDIFTLIHQNLLIISGILLKCILKNNIEKPELFKKLENILLTPLNGFLPSYTDSISYDIYYTIQKSYFLSISFENEKMQARYNLPLRNHSVVFEINFNKKQKESIELKISFCGQARGRWDNINDFSKLIFLFCDGRVLKTNLIGPNELTFTLQINEFMPLKNFNAYLEYIIRATTVDVKPIFIDALYNDFWDPNMIADKLLNIDIDSKNIFLLSILNYLVGKKKCEAIYELSLDVAMKALNHNDYIAKIGHLSLQSLACCILRELLNNDYKKVDNYLHEILLISLIRKDEWRSNDPINLDIKLKDLFDLIEKKDLSTKMVLEMLRETKKKIYKKLENQSKKLSIKYKELYNYIEYLIKNNFKAGYSYAYEIAKYSMESKSDTITSIAEKILNLLNEKGYKPTTFC
ncbi:hypothetical protein GF322_04830 [Candidatus Dependentiae bacterium]|nr:hypothetical protein [Candidatus Dependentiae bacterium]